MASFLQISYKIVYDNKNLVEKNQIQYKLTNVWCELLPYMDVVFI